MKIAVLGAGNVGRTLGRRWAEAGHDVIYGVRKPSGDQEVTMPEACEGAEAVVLAVPWAAVEGILAATDGLAGKIVIDATNPIRSDFTGLTVGTDDSAGEIVQRLAPQARVVKAFNTVGFNLMENPIFPSGAATMLVAGDDDSAKTTVMKLASDLGFDPVDAGPIVQSRGLEAMAWLWISLAMRSGREFAFFLNRRG